MLIEFLCLLAVLWTGEVWEFVSFAERYPSIIYNILLFGFTSALGQVRHRITHTCISLSYYFAYRYSPHLPLSDLHLYDSCVFWASHLLHRHDDKEVLHHPWLCAVVWEHHHPLAVAWNHPCFPR